MILSSNPLSGALACKLFLGRGAFSPLMAQWRVIPPGNHRAGSVQRGLGQGPVSGTTGPRDAPGKPRAAGWQGRLGPGETHMLIVKKL